MDLDCLRRAWPPPPGDRFHLELALANLRDVSANARSAGLERLVLSGVVESRADKARYAAAVGGELLQIRLKPSRGAVSAQLHRLRHVDRPGRNSCGTWPGPLSLTRSSISPTPTTT